jgi:hypothetical protein
MIIWKIIIAIIFIIGWNLLASRLVLSLRKLVKKYKNLNPLTYLVGTFEIVAASLITKFYLSRSESTMAQKVTVIGAFIGGWFAIKSFSHDLEKISTEKEISFTEIHYSFILGTIFSLAGGVILGIILFHIS